MTEHLCSIADYRNMSANSCHITRTLRQKWPEAIRSLSDRSDLFFATGIEELDRLFPSGRGIPYGQLIEIRGGLSSGKTSLLFRILAGGQPSRTIAYVDFGNSFFPDATVASGVDLSRLLVIRPTAVHSSNVTLSFACPEPVEGSKDDPNNPTINGERLNRQASLPDDGSIQTGLRAAELLLRDHHADIIVFDLVGRRIPLPIGLLHRLRLRTVRAKGLVVFLTQVDTSATDIIPSSMASLRLETARLDDTHPNRLMITITKSRICAEGVQLTVHL